MAHEIEWLTPSGAPASDRGRNSVEDTVSHLEPVHAACHRQAIFMGLQAQALLLQHRRHGHAKVQVDKFRSPPGARTPDWYVYLQDADPGGRWHGSGHAGGVPHRSAMSIEFGWTQTHAFGKKLAAPIEHDGLGILASVMDRASARYPGPQ